MLCLIFCLDVRKVEILAGYCVTKILYEWVNSRWHIVCIMYREQRLGLPKPVPERLKDFQKLVDKEKQNGVRYKNNKY